MDGIFCQEYLDIEEDGKLYKNLSVFDFSKNCAKSFHE